MPRGKKKVEDAVKAVEEKVVATEVEVKKASRATGRKAKAKVTESVEKVAEKVADVAAAAEVEVKKTASRAKRAVKKTEAKVEEAAKPARKARAAKLDIVIQSVMGGAITPEEIAAKVPLDDVLCLCESRGEQDLLGEQSRRNRRRGNLGLIHK